MRFADRAEAGRLLADRLQHLRGPNVVVVGLPRGGVPVAYQVAQALGAPLDIIVVRKLGVPYQPELAMGAIGEGGVRVLDEDTLRAAGVTEDELSVIEKREQGEVERRARRFRGDRASVPLAGRTVVVVDDGLATGSTARAACRIARAAGAGRVVLAVPVAPRGWTSRMLGEADELVAVTTPAHLYAIGQWYADFSPTPEEEVVACLEQSAGATDGLRPEPARDPPADLEAADREVLVRAAGADLGGQLTVPARARGLVVFAHGSGSGRLSPRNRSVAAALNDAGLGTLLLDLLTPEEEGLRRNVFDVRLLAARLGDTVRWVRTQPAVAELPVGFFGASTGAAAALWAAAELGADVDAVVSRGGRPDLALARLDAVTAPTLLIVGGRDEQVLELNRQAQARLRCESRLAVVPGATHLFEEPGTLQQVAVLARDWFVHHLTAQPQVASG